jgi:hypothetical protein
MKKSKSQKKANKTTKYILNCLPSRDRENDWLIDNAEEADLISTAPIPASKDLRDDSWWEIGNQEATGSCVGWATADSVLRWHYVTSGWIDKKEMLSPRFIWMAAKETDAFVSRPTTFIEKDGTSLKAALDIARRYGVVTNDVLPFKSGKLYSGTANTFYALAAHRRIASYFNLGGNLTNWRRWIAGNGPILTRLNVDQTWDQATNNQGNLDIYLSETARGGHAVALVGYTKDRFIVRNSWGPTWGANGYAFASNEYASTAFTEAYGITL